jgi:putative oxidoreductase
LTNVPVFRHVAGSTIRQVGMDMARTDDFAVLLGRLAIAALFLPSGFGKLVGFTGFAAMLATKGLPVPEAWAAVGVLCEFGATLLVLVGFQMRVAALAIAAFTVMAAILGHPYWSFPDAAVAAANRTQFFKDIAIAGGLLFLYVTGAGLFSVDGWRRRLVVDFR